MSGEVATKLLGAPKINSDTSEEKGTAVFSLIQDWNLTDRMQFMSFDTTASNTRPNSGACMLLEQKLGRNLVSLACRQNVIGQEWIVARVFGDLMDASSRPSILRLFERSTDFW